MQKILLLDIENCPHSSERLLAQLKQYAQVCLVYAKSNMSLSLDDLVQFEPYLRDQRLKLLKMPTVGKDSADFGLAFLAGRLSQYHNPSEAAFDVFSNDRAIGYIVELLQQFGFNAVHLKSEVVVPVAPPSNTAQIELPIKKNKEKTETIPTFKIEQHLQKLAEVLVKNQPKTTTALCNGIRAWLKIEHQQANALMLFMQQQKIIQIQNKTVAYQKQKLKQIIHCPTTDIPTLSLIRSDVSKEIPALTEIQSKLHLIHVRQYCEYLQKQQGKPATQKALIRSLAAVLKIESENLLKNRFKLLKNYGILMVLEDEKLVYDHQVITKWVEQSGFHCTHLPIQQDTKHSLSVENHLSDIQQIQSEEKKQLRLSSHFMTHEQEIIQTLRDRLNLSHGLKPKYIAGFSVLLEQLFPQLPLETSLSILEKNELIQINNRKVTYSPVLLGS